MSNVPRIFITPGEPAGIGPDITIQIAQQAWDAELIVVADPDLLLQRARLLNLPLQLQTWDAEVSPAPHSEGTLKILPVALATAAIPGKLNAANAEYVLNTLRLAADMARIHSRAALVTGPVHKEIINLAGHTFTGHTEFFANHCHVAHTVMLFVVDQLKVALATTHLALTDVPKAITKERLRLTLATLQAGLQQHFQLTTPHILVCGLNPHAGEGGYLGREEIEVITPLLDDLRAHSYALTGPLAADTIFTPKQLQQADAVLAMYHDQALPVVKYLGFGNAVNMTLGLPFVRTSVDHGTALDVAGTGTADTGSILAALKLAIKISKLHA